MEKFVVYIKGLRIEKNYSFTFCNGFKLCHFSNLKNDKTADLLLNTAGSTDYYILYKELSIEKITSELIIEARDILDIISIHLKDHLGIYILAASQYYLSNVPTSIDYGIKSNITEEILNSTNQRLGNFNNFPEEQKEKLRVALKFLNKAKYIDGINTSIDATIFIRVAMENIFGSPHDRIRLTIAERAAFLLNEFNETEVIKGFKKFYDQTSRVIHTGTLPKKLNKSKNQKVIIEGKMMYELLSLSVRKILDNGFPKWETFKLSFRNRLKNAIIKLIDEKF